MVHCGMSMLWYTMVQWFIVVSQCYDPLQIDNITVHCEVMVPCGYASVMGHCVHCDEPILAYAVYANAMIKYSVTILLHMPML
ncbi:hypothetical protein CEXT_321961 [Caerostris extrusa]|uniref:Secreted protein n=1 Tax=Caerostris extrusa TaxID=172846 RepID=A0AAV4QH88_CAEEX|nr:hypothetical protein CEXT_321961 [Caerostris extrusa]